ncbi:MAG: methyltransferase domain-containing protein, partial [Dehalococcoidia bacterium]
LQRTAWIDWAMMDLRRLALRPESFDLLLAVGCFASLPEGTSLATLLDEMASVLAPQGRILFTLWNRERWLAWDWLDFSQRSTSSFTEQEIRVAIESAGLRLRACRTTMFEPRRLLPLVLRGPLVRPLRHVLIQLLIVTNRRLTRHHWSNRRGREWIVLAVKE